MENFIIYFIVGYGLGMLLLFLSTVVSRIRDKLRMMGLLRDPTSACYKAMETYKQAVADNERRS